MLAGVLWQCCGCLQTWRPGRPATSAGNSELCAVFRDAASMIEATSWQKSVPRVRSWSGSSDMGKALGMPSLSSEFRSPGEV